MAQRISPAKRTVRPCVSINRVTSPPSCASSTWSSTRATRARSTSPPRRSGSPDSSRHRSIIPRWPGAGAHAASPRPAGGPAHCRRRPGAACRAGPKPLGQPADQEGVEVLQAALARDRLGEFQAQAAIAALHADAQTAAETDWVQIVEWYDELARLTDSPIVRLNRAVAVGEADGARAGLAALAALDPSLPRYTAVATYLHERDGNPGTAATLYAEAAHAARQPRRAEPLDAAGRPAQCSPRSRNGVRRSADAGHAAGRAPRSTPAPPLPQGRASPGRTTRGRGSATRIVPAMAVPSEDPRLDTVRESPEISPCRPSGKLD